MHGSSTASRKPFSSFVVSASLALLDFRKLFDHAFANQHAEAHTLEYRNLFDAVSKILRDTDSDGSHFAIYQVLPNIGTSAPLLISSL